MKNKKITEIRTEKKHKILNIFVKVNKSGLNVKKHFLNLVKLGDVLYTGYKKSDFVERRK